MSDSPPIAFIKYKSTGLLLAAATLAAMVISILICVVVGATRMIPVDIISGILSLAVVLLSLVLTWFQGKKGLVALIRGFMFSQFIRLFLGTIVVVIMVLAMGFDVRITVVWVLGWYWLLLALEVLILQRSVSKSISLNNENKDKKNLT